MHTHKILVISLLSTLSLPHIPNFGLLELENATIMNTALLRTQKLTKKNFEHATNELSLGGRLVFVTSNEGILLSCEVE